MTAPLLFHCHLYKLGSNCLQGSLSHKIPPYLVVLLLQVALVVGQVAQDRGVVGVGRLLLEELQLQLGLGQLLAGRSAQLLVCKRRPVPRVLLHIVFVCPSRRFGVHRSVVVA
jgi:hypothetical protein